MKLDTYVPTPIDDLSEMLSGLEKGDVYCDLGSGDGRLLLCAWVRASKVIGYELNAEMAAKSRAIIPPEAEIREEDFMEADWSEFDYLTFFGDECWSDLIREKFRAEARSGARLQMYREPLIVQP